MNQSSSRDTASVVLRSAVGAILIGHGAQKLFGWFGGGGLEGTGRGMHVMGFRPGRTHALAAGITEVGSGAALTLGLATPAAGAAAATAMGVAAGAQAANGFFAAKNGLEYPAALGVIATSFVIGGPGAVSVDALTDRLLDRPWMRIVALAVIPIAIALQLRRRTAALRSDTKP